MTMIFANLLAQAFLIQFEPVDTRSGQLSIKSLKQKIMFSLLSSVFSIVVYMPLAYAFKKTKRHKVARVDHLLYVDKSGSHLDARARVTFWRF